MELIWRETEQQPASESLLTDALGIHPLTARLLTNRGILEPNAAYLFLNPRLADLHDPFLLPDMDKAAHRIADAVHNGERIFIHGDYDVDGVTSTAVYVRSLIKLGADVTYRVPHRKLDGYDLRIGAIDWAREQGASLTITTDCGIQAREAVDHANQLGMTVIVTDHHEPGEILPDAYAVVNPHRRDSTYPFPNLAGVGVAFKTMQAVTRLLKPEWENAFIKNFLDLVACGTVADVMPLFGENRVFARHGLEALRNTKKAGLQALLAGAGIDTTRKLNADTVGFGIAPRINAVGRVDDAAIALDLMLTADASEAQRLVARLNECNAERQSLQRRVLAEAVQKVVEGGLANKPLLIVAGKNWNAGVVGIVAGKLVDQFYRPTIVISISDDGAWGKGSARSIPALDIFQAISECQDLLDTCGGHSHAAGLSLTMDQLEIVSERLYAHAGARLTVDDYKQRLSIDAIVPPESISVELLDSWDQLEPYGQGNPPPLLASHKVKLGSKRRMGKDMSHLKITVEQNSGESPWQRDCVAWSRAEPWDSDLDNASHIDIAYVPSINAYQGRRSLQLTIKDLRDAS